MKTILKPDNGLDIMISHLRHELRSPVAAALMHLGLLERTLSALDGGGRAMNSLEQARRALGSLDRLVDRTLDAYHRQGAVSLRREEVDLDRLIGEVLDKIGASNPAAIGQIESSGAPGVVARVDPTAVEEILANLLTNAIKFGEGKPIRLTVERPPDGVRLLVRDLGCGIDLEEQQVVFGPFGPGSSGRTVPALGLGLWIVCKMVEAHDGRITVDSRPGGGTQFDVFLPG